MGYKDPEKQREYARKWRAERRRKYMEGAVCAKCGSDGPLELDHLDRRQKVDHKIWSWAEDRIKAEMVKCQWLCVPCHIQKTADDLGYQLNNHGTRNMYNRHRCRCEECRAWNAARAKRQRKALKTARANRGELT